MKRILFFNLLLFVLIVAVVELVFGNWIVPDRINELGILRNYDDRIDVAKLHNGGKMDYIHYKRDKYGLRGEYSSPESIDILTVGGSTTDQRGIGEGKTWQDLMVKYFRDDGVPLSIVNAGIDGQSTVGHILDFDLWFKKIPGLHPKYIIFYIGINDFYVGDDATVTEHPGSGSLWDRIKSKSYFYYLFRLARGMWEVYGQKTLLGHQSIDFEKEAWIKGPPLRTDHAKIMAKRLGNYGDRIRILYKKAIELGSRPVFVTQYVRSEKDEGGQRYYLAKTVDYGRYKINGADVTIMMDLLNKRNLSVCGDLHAICIDLASDLTFGNDDFYDYVHPSEKGTEKIARYLKQQLAPYIEASVKRR